MAADTDVSTAPNYSTTVYEEAVWQVHKPGSSHLPHTPTMVVVTCIETEVTWTGETHYPRHPGVNFHLKRDIPHHENKTSNY